MQSKAGIVAAGDTFHRSAKRHRCHIKIRARSAHLLKPSAVSRQLSAGNKSRARVSRLSSFSLTVFRLAHKCRTFLFFVIPDLIRNLCCLFPRCQASDMGGFPFPISHSPFPAKRHKTGICAPRILYRINASAHQPTKKAERPIMGRPAFFRIISPIFLPFHSSQVFP